jgi:hypothetical protein
MAMMLWSLKSWKFLAAAALATSLGGCAGGANYYAGQPGPNHPFSNNALADEVFLDGTGPSSRQAGRTIRYQAETPAPGAPSRAVANSRPLAIEREARSDAVSGTTGARSQSRSQSQGQSDPNKPFSDAWWERERAEDAKLQSRMNICRGC